ncbi:MAG TPA: enoyl-CoA hydratase-related protein [Thermodesulfobacteriota bacterium]
MNFVNVDIREGVAKIFLNRPKVNAINGRVLNELAQCFDEIRRDDSAKALILTGEGSFFSFGFDVPELYNYKKEDFTEFMFNFSDMLRNVFLFPKPVLAALNGHTIAGGCILALACDYRLMVAEKAKISLNEITFGSTLFSSAVEMLRFLVGSKNASTILYSGRMYSADEALRLGLIDNAVSRDELLSSARSIAEDHINKDTLGFKGIKSLLRNRVADYIKDSEKDSILEFVDIWYSESVRTSLRKIVIKD